MHTMFLIRFLKNKNIVYILKMNLQIRDKVILVKNYLNDNYVNIVCQRVSSRWDRTQALTLLSGLLPYNRN